MSISRPQATTRSDLPQAIINRNRTPHTAHRTPLDNTFSRDGPLGEKHARLYHQLGLQRLHNICKSYEYSPPPQGTGEKSIHRSPNNFLLTQTQSPIGSYVGSLGSEERETTCLFFMQGMRDKNDWSEVTEKIASPSTTPT